MRVKWPKIGFSIRTALKIFCPKKRIDYQIMKRDASLAQFSIVKSLTPQQDCKTTKLTEIRAVCPVQGRRLGGAQGVDPCGSGCRTKTPDKTYE